MPRDDADIRYLRWQMWQGIKWVLGTGSIISSTSAGAGWGRVGGGGGSGAQHCDLRL
ncbi:MAG: hypothetical protein KY447_07140 [Actinobacteria bacterium]|nr:hypothetical protein [Actinomycetota bacterium]